MFYYGIKTYLKGEIKMDDKNYKLLNEVIESGLDGLSLFESGTKEHSDAVADIATLYKLKIEEEKIQLDNDLKVNQLKEQIANKIVELNDVQHVYEQDCVFREKQLSEQKKERYLRVSLEVASIIIPLMFYRQWMKEGFKFEETGTYTSATFRGLIGKFRPTR